MRKKWLILILLLFLIPNVVLAGDDCSSSTISGDASSGAVQIPSSGDCNDSVCLSTYNQNFVGVRFQIYKYNGSGDYKDIILVGKGVDVWATNGLINNNFLFTSPTTPNTRNKASCDNATFTASSKSSGYSTDASQVYTLTDDEYLSGDYGVIAYDTAIRTHFREGKMNQFILTHSNGETTGGWLHTNFFAKISSGDSTKYQQVKNLFNLTDTEFKDLQSHPQDYYVTAEILYRFVAQRSNYGYKGGYYYLGTSSEAAFFEGWNGIYQALRSSGGSVGKLASTDAKSGSYLIKQESSVSATFFYNSASIANSGGKSDNAKAACRSALGYAVWHISTVCEDCGEVEPLYDQLEFDGCPTSTKNKCANHPTAKKTITDDDCEALEASGTTQRHLGSQTCYEDNYESYIVVQKASNLQDDASYIKAETATNQPNYWKIDCTEDLYLKDLPTAKTVNVNELGIGNLYLGYTTKYQKECKLYYRVKDKDASVKWKQSYSGSLLEQHLKDYKTYLTEVENALKTTTDAEAKKRLNDVKPKIEDAIKALEKVEEKAQEFLDNIDTKDYSDDIPVVNNATIKLVQETETEEVLKLVPAFCQFNKESKNYCDLKTGLGEYYENDVVACDDPSSEEYAKTMPDLTEEQKKSMTAKAIEEYEKKAAIANKFNRKYIKTVYYALPSTYVATLYNGKSRVFHSQSECENAIAGQSTSNACKEVEHVWIFTDVDSPQITLLNEKLSTSSLKINLSGYGSCGQFEYGMTCKYEFQKSTACTKCIYDYTDSSGRIIDQDAYDACFARYCSCDSYCGSDVACRFKYCPEECVGCGVGGAPKECNTCEQECDNKYSGTSDEAIENRALCKYNDCCRLKCNGNEGCIFQCCQHECDEICAGNENSEACKTCYDKCPPEIKIGGDYIYRTINLSRPFPNGDDVEGRTPGANWYGKVEHITKANIDTTKYYDATNGFNDDYEYAFVFTSDQLKKLNSKYNTSTTIYSDFYESTKAKNVENENVYCSSIIHEYLDEINVTVEGNRTTNKVGSGCEVK